MKMRHRRQEARHHRQAPARERKLTRYQRRMLRAYSSLMNSMFDGHTVVPFRSYREPRLYRPSQVTP